MLRFILIITFFGLLVEPTLNMVDDFQSKVVDQEVEEVLLN